MTSADCSARTARSVSNSGIAGTGADQRHRAGLHRGAEAAHLVEEADEVVIAGARRRDAVTACAVNRCQNLRRAANGRPDAFTAARQRAAASAHSAKPFGSSASSLARIACANTGAAPSVDMPITSGERLTIAPKEKSQNAGLSMTLTGTPAHPRGIGEDAGALVVVEGADRDRRAAQIVRPPVAPVERDRAARRLGSDMRAFPRTASGA